MNGVLSINARQFEALAAPFEAAIIEWHVERISQRIPNLPDVVGENAAAFIRRSRAAALEMHFQHEEEIAVWVDIMIDIACSEANFERIREIVSAYCNSINTNLYIPTSVIIANYISNNKKPGDKL